MVLPQSCWCPLPMWQPVWPMGSPWAIMWHLTHLALSWWEGIEWAGISFCQFSETKEMTAGGWERGLCAPCGSGSGVCGLQPGRKQGCKKHTGRSRTWILLKVLLSALLVKQPQFHYAFVKSWELIIFPCKWRDSTEIAVTIYPCWWWDVDT